MNARPLVVTLTVLLLLASGPVAAAPDGERLGRVHFPVSCAPTVQGDFERAVALLHSFWYEEALKAFTAITTNDPGCAMGYWGIAMSVYYPLWAPPSPAMLQTGTAALAKTRGLTATPREQDYIAAIETYYRDADKLDHRSRAIAYEKAMGQLFARYPDDREAAVFYALALNATAAPTDKTYANQLKAGAILEKVFAEQPAHPGVAHYIIHSFDYPAIAQLALPAARAYSRIAPSAPHALHMPSHIFTRLGLWDESIASNLASAAAAREWVARSHPGATAFDELHALDYLEYAYLQTCRHREADEVAEKTARVERVDEAQFAAAYALAAVPVRHALERRDWGAAQAVTLRPASFPWDRFLNAMGGARGGAPDKGRAAYERLVAIQNAMIEKKDSYWAGQAQVQRLEAGAWIAQAEGRGPEALTMLRAAADAEDASEKHPVTPGHVLPAREQLGDLLLEQGRAKEALAAYEAALAVAPNRYHSLAGARRAAEQAGEAELVRRYAGAVEALCGQP